MLKRPLVAMLLVWLVMASTLSAAVAQGPQPPTMRPHLEMHSRTPTAGAPEEGHKGLPAANPLAVAPSASAPAKLGEPGLSFRYLRTIGVTEEAYPADGDHLNWPGGMFIDSSGNFYVVEIKGERVLKYNASGANVLTIGKAGYCMTGDYTFCDPRDVVVDAAGSIWVADRNRVVQYDENGAFLQQMPESDPWNGGTDNTHFNNIFGIVMDQTGRLVVADFYNHRVQVYTFSNGKPVYSATIGVTAEPGTDNLHLRRPAGLAVDAGNRLYIADSGNGRIQRCTFGSVWDCAPFIQGLGDVRGVAVKGNSVYIGDSGNGRVLKCDLSGACIDLVTGLEWFEDVAVDSSDRVYVSEIYLHRVRRFNPQGGGASTFAGTDFTPYAVDKQRLYRPWGVAVAPTGGIYVLENMGYRLVRIRADGSQDWTAGSPGNWGEDSLLMGSGWAGLEGNPAVDSLGNIYVPDTGNNRVQIFRPDGSLLSTFGQWGNGDYEFGCPTGVAVSPDNGDIFVTDHCNQRIQVYTGKLVYKATIGVLDQIGDDNAHLNWPYGVAVNRNGDVFIADTENFRIQKCRPQDNGYDCSTFAGITGESGDDLAHFHPRAVAVDEGGRVYVADDWNDRVQVFDAAGAYLTTLGANWGSGTGDMREPAGVAVDSDGLVYVMEAANHRVQVYAPGVPGWRQVNINGFGERWSQVSALAEFGGKLFAARWDDDGNGASVWRLDDGTWSLTSDGGFGEGVNYAVDHLIAFKGRLYAGTWSWDLDSNTAPGGQVWRSPDGENWTKVVDAGFGDDNNDEVFRFTVFKDQLYASTLNWDEETGASAGTQIWRSASGDAGDWQRVVNNGFGFSKNQIVVAFAEHSARLYAGTGTLGQVWRSADGAQWNQVNVDGFGVSDNSALGSLAVFGGWLYAGVSNSVTGAQVWRCQVCDGSDWSQIVGDGFGNVQNTSVRALHVFIGRLYAFTWNYRGDGMEVWRSSDGVQWQSDAPAGLGNANRYGAYWGNAVAVANGRLYAGVLNRGHGAQVWQKTVTADFEATPMAGAPPLAVVFTNRSIGDTTGVVWDFGDGGQISTAAFPTHVYQASGSYTVTLTVTDGVDSHTLERPALVQAWHRVFLPVMGRSVGSDLYDDFDDPAFDGDFDRGRWRQEYGPELTFSQQSGRLVMQESPGGGGACGGLGLSRWPQRSLAQLQTLQVRLAIAGGAKGAGNWHLHMFSPQLNGHKWFTECNLNSETNPQRLEFGCVVYFDKGQGWEFEHATPHLPVSFDRWYNITIETAPDTGRLRYYLDGALVDSYLPNDAMALVTAHNISSSLGGCSSPGSSIKRLADDIRITPAQR